MKHVLVFITMLMLIPTAASAQTGDAARAKGHYDSGAALYFKGDYAEAVVEFMRAYDALPEPVFLYNIAMSHWRLGNLNKAIESGERALRLEMPADLHAQVSARTLVFRQLDHIDSSDWTRPQVEPPAESTEVVALPEPEPASPPRTLRWVGVGSAAVGAALVGTWVGAEVGLQQLIGDYEDAAEAGDTSAYEELSAKIERRQPVALALLWSGVTLVGVGAGLIVWDFARGSESSLALEIGPQRVSLRWVW